MKAIFFSIICLILNSGAVGLYAADDASVILKKADADFDNKDYLSAVAGYTLYNQNLKFPNIDYALYRIGEAKLKIAEYPERRMVQNYPESYKKWKDCDKYLEYIDNNAEDFPAFEPAGSHIYSGREFKKLIELYPQSKYAAMGAYHLLKHDRIGDWEGTFPAAEFVRKDIAFLKKYPQGYFNNEVVSLAVSDYRDAICSDPEDGAIITKEEKQVLFTEFGAFSDNTVPVLIGSLKNGDENTRLSAVIALRRIGPIAKSAIPVLTGALKDTNPEVSFFAAKALIDIDSTVKAIVPVLIDALKDKENRRYAMVALRDIGPGAKDAIPSLMNLLENENGEMRSDIAAVLIDIGLPAKEAMPILINLLKDASWMARLTAAGSLGKLGTAAKEAVPVLTNAISNAKDGTERIRIAEALFRIDPTSTLALQTLLHELSNGTQVPRAQAAESLGRIGLVSKDIAPALINALRNQDKYVRSHVIAVLGGIDSMTKETVPVLIPLLKNGDYAMGWSVLSAFSKMGAAAKDAIPAVIEKLDDQHLSARAAETLGNIGPDAKEAVPALTLMLQGSTTEIQSKAAEALQKISQPNQPRSNLEKQMTAFCAIKGSGF